MPALPGCSCGVGVGVVGGGGVATGSGSWSVLGPALGALLVAIKPDDAAPFPFIAAGGVILAVGVQPERLG